MVYVSNSIPVRRAAANKVRLSMPPVMARRMGFPVLARRFNDLDNSRSRLLAGSPGARLLGFGSERNFGTNDSRSSHCEGSTKSMFGKLVRGPQYQSGRDPWSS